MSSGKYVSRSPKNVIHEIEYLIKNFSIQSIYFQDLEFLIQPERVNKICQLILDKKLKFNWGCNVRANDIIRDSNLIKKMKQAGCQQINLGLESASNQILANINKKITQEDLQKAVDILKKYEIQINYYVLLGCPGETKETIKETVDFIAKNNLSFKNFNRIVPYPGTQLFKELKKQHPYKKFKWENIEHYAGRVGTKLTPRKALFFLRHYKYQYQSGRFYYLKPLFWLNLIKNKLY